MSYTQEITNELINYEGLKANSKILLLVLMTHRNREKGYAYPSFSNSSKHFKSVFLLNPVFLINVDCEG